MMMHGIGMVENLLGLSHFLSHVQQLVKLDGRILFDSMDVRDTTDSKYLAIHEARRQIGRYIGETRMQFEYKGKMGAHFGWLHVHLQTLMTHARKTGWSCQIIHKDDDGDYLAQLYRAL